MNFPSVLEFSRRLCYNGRKTAQTKRGEGDAVRLPKNVSYIIDRLRAGGHRADVVGGPVRDFLLGKAPADYDITTDATPERVKAVFSGHRTVDVGIQHGTVALILDGEQYEITTYRVDGEYTDSRHPDSVAFTTDITEDLRRRDFTMNAIAYNPADGITDPYGGARDIEARVIRAVGDPATRFTEDALRILRGARFAAVLGFRVEEKTAEAMLRLSPRLRSVSAERIYVEWEKLTAGEFAYGTLESFLPVVLVFLPELAGLRMPPRESFAAATPEARRLALFLSAGLEDASKCFYSAMKRLKTKTSVCEYGRDALRVLGDGGFDRSTVGHRLKEYGVEVLRLAADTAEALGRRELAPHSAIDEYLATGRPFEISGLGIGGKDLLSLGYSGRSVGVILRHLLDRVIDGELENDARALIEAVDSIIPCLSE